MKGYMANEKRYIHFFEANDRQIWDELTFNEGLLSTKSGDHLVLWKHSHIQNSTWPLD